MAAECGEAAATLFQTQGGPRRAVRHSGSCRSRFWTTGSATRELTIMYSSSILFFPISSSSFPTAYSLTVDLVPVPVYSAAITACLLKGSKNKQIRQASGLLLSSRCLYFSVTFIRPGQTKGRTSLVFFQPTFKQSPTNISLRRLLFSLSPSQ